MKRRLEWLRHLTKIPDHCIPKICLSAGYHRHTHLEDQEGDGETWWTGTWKLQASGRRAGMRRLFTDGSGTKLTVMDWAPISISNSRWELVHPDIYCVMYVDATSGGRVTKHVPSALQRDASQSVSKDEQCSVQSVWDGIGSWVVSPSTSAEVASKLATTAYVFLLPLPPLG